MSTQDIFSQQTQDILNLILAHLKEKKAEDISQDTLSTLILASEHVTSALRLIRSTNYQENHK
jgi:hypothetical protein